MHLTTTTMRMSTMVPVHPLVREKGVHSIGTIVSVLSLQTSFEGVIGYDFNQRLQLF